MNGAEAMVRCLEAEGVSTVFGYPGVAIAPFYEGLYNSDIRHVLVRQEQNAGHAASGYARISRKPAVCVATSGPGAVNLITAIATAYADSIPVVAITGQVSTKQIGRDVFQEADVTGAVEPFTKYRYLVRDADDIPRVFREAFYIASTGRKGPVLIDVPVDVQQTELTKEFSYPETVEIRGYKPAKKSNKQQLNRVIRAIETAKRPLICAGGGVILSEAESAVREFSEKYHVPVVTTLMGIGTIPKKHPMYFGMIGNNGKPYANYAMANSDLLIITGARVADRAVPNAQHLEDRVPVIHIDIDTAEIGKNLGPTIPLVGDVRDVYRTLIDADLTVDTEDWIRELTENKHATVDSRVFSELYVDPNLLVRTLCEKLDDDAVYTADVGQNQLWSADNYIMKKGRFLTTGGMGTMGYAIPCAIGAKMCAPDRQVVAVCGDGSFQMSMNEFATARVNHVPLKVIVMRNHYLGLVKEYQFNNYDSHYSGVELFNYPNYDKIAEAYDMDYFEVTDNRFLDGELDRFLASKNASLMVCEIDSVDNVK